MTKAPSVARIVFRAEVLLPGRIGQKIQLASPLKGQEDRRHSICRGHSNLAFLLQRRVQVFSRFWDFDVGASVFPESKNPHQLKNELTGTHKGVYKAVADNLIGTRRRR